MDLTTETCCLGWRHLLDFVSGQKKAFFVIAFKLIVAVTGCAILIGFVIGSDEYARKQHCLVNTITKQSRGQEDRVNTTEPLCQSSIVLNFSRDDVRYAADVSGSLLATVLLLSCPPAIAALYGLYRRRRRFLMPWLIMTGLRAAVTVVAAVAFTAKGWHRMTVKLREPGALFFTYVAVAVLDTLTEWPVFREWMKPDAPATDGGEEAVPMNGASRGDDGEKAVPMNATARGDGGTTQDDR